MNKTISHQVRTALGVLDGIRVLVNSMERDTTDEEEWGTLGKGDLRELLVWLNSAADDLGRADDMCNEADGLKKPRRA